MKNLLTTLALLISLNLSAQCERKISLTGTIQWGIDNKGFASMNLEAGIWGISTPLSIGAGITTQNKIKTLINDKGEQETYREPAIAPHLRLGVKFLEYDKWINQFNLIVSKQPSVNYLCYYRAGERILLGAGIQSQMGAKPQALLNTTFTF